MPIYLSRLEYREEICKGTIAFGLQKPVGFRFRAGQYVELALIKPTKRDIGGDTRTFSIASAPFEDELQFAMRLSKTAFKQVLAALPLGAEVEIRGPAGVFALHEDARRPAVFLAGGIGLAPFLSILRQARHDQIGRDIYLFYSNRRPEDAAYLGELQEWAKANHSFRFIPTMTRMEESRILWSGETDLIDAKMLSRLLPDLIVPVYYVSGPSRFVTGMISVLTVLNVEETNIRTEDFGEY